MADDEKQKKPRRRRAKKDGEAETTDATDAAATTEAEATEEKPAAKPRRRRAKKDADAGDATAEAKTEDKSEDKAEADAAADDDAEDKPKRRGSAETSTPKAQPQAKPEPRRDAQGAVIVQARARYVRSAPRKARLVMDHIRGKPVQDAVAMLTHTPRSASRDVLKLLNSAIANAENNYELGADELRVHRATVDEGPTLKRFQPRALGRATRIDKRTSHMTIMLTTATEPTSSAKRKRRR